MISKITNTVHSAYTSAANTVSSVRNMDANTVKKTAVLSIGAIVTVGGLYYLSTQSSVKQFVNDVNPLTSNWVNPFHGIREFGTSAYQSAANSKAGLYIAGKATIAGDYAKIAKSYVAAKATDASSYVATSRAGKFVAEKAALVAAKATDAFNAIKAYFPH